MSPRNQHIGEIAVREGLVSRKEVEAAVEASTLGDERPLEELLLQMNLITGTQLDRIRTIHRRESAPDNPTVAPPAPTNAAEIFGRTVVALGFSTESQVRECLQEQRRLSRENRTMRLGQIMVKRRYITSEQFLEALRLQEEFIWSCASCASKHFVEGTGVRFCHSCGDELPGPSTAVDEPAPSEPTIKIPPAPSRPNSMIEEGILGKYRIQNEIGRGSLGIVYRALDEPLNRIVALKTLQTTAASDPKTVEHFVREAKTAARLNHASIVTLHEVGNVGDTPYLAMEFIEGDPLEALLEAGRITRDDALRILEQVARGLDYAHAEGVCHGNLNPSNILIDAQKRPHITDFGLGRVGFLTRPLTEDPIDIGPPDYLAPEQVRGDRKSVDARSDIYALGVILYRLLTGTVPHRADDRAETYRKILEAEARRPREVVPGIEDELDTLCRRAMERDRSVRFASAREFADDLNRFLAGRPIEARPVSVLQRLRRRARRNRMLVPATLVVLAALIGGGIWLTGYLAEKNRIRNEREAMERRERAASHQKVADLEFEKLQAPALTRERALTHLKSCRIALDAAIAEDETFAEPYAMRARLAEREGDLDEALADWNKAVEHGDRTFLADRATVRLIRYGLLSGAPVRMSGRFGQTAALTDTDPEWAREERDAMKSDFEAVRIDKNISRALRLCAEAASALAGGQYDKAARRAMSVDPRDARYPTALRIRALAYFRRGNLRRSYRDLLSLQERLPQIPGNEAAGEFGFYSKGELTWALTKASSPRASVFRGLIHEALGEPEKAMKEYSAAADRVDGLARRAFLHLEMKDTAKAMEDAAAACRRDPNHMHALLARAAIYTETGRYDQAVLDLDRVLKNRGEDVGGNYLRGRCRLELDEANTALPDARRSVEVLTIFHPGYLLRARLHGRFRNFLGAIEDMATAIRLKGDDPDLYWHRGYFRVLAGEPRDGMKDFREALRLDPEHVNALVWHAVAVSAAGDDAAGMREINAFIRNHPRHSAGFRWRGYLHARARRYREAIADLETAIERGAPEKAELQRQIEQMKGELRKRNQPARNWPENFNKAMAHIQAVIDNDTPEKAEKTRREHYPKALKFYLAGIPYIPNPPPKGNARVNLAIGLYNVACIYAVQAGWESDPAKREALTKQSLKWLSVCLELGFGARPCTCGKHADKTGFGHAREDRDFSAIKVDPRFQRLVNPKK